MDKTVTENLFLLEFLVDKVQIDPSIMQDYGDVTGDTCVSVQFLDNAPLDICEDDFAPKRRYSKETDNIKSGKSCLFSLTPAQANQAVQQFDVYVDVFKKMQSGVLPEKLQVGHSLISIVNLFKELIDSVVNNDSGSAPTAKTLKDTFKVTNAAGQYIGDIGMYIRMSCFGKLIVTQFQMNLEDKSVLFKDKEGHSLYRYKKAGKTQNGNGFGSSSGLGHGSGSQAGGWGQSQRNTKCPEVPCPRPQQQQQQQQQRPRRPSASVYDDTDSPCNECGAMQVPMAPPVDPNPPGCYQEIGAQMGGNALTIRVHKESNKLEQMDEDDDDGSCSCGNGSYGKGKRPRMSGGASAVCSCSNQDRNLTMRGGNEGAAGTQPFSFKMGGCGMGAQNNVTVVPPVCTAPDGTQYTELSDPDRDVFILRIGKKSEGMEKKNNLELELCTPKGPDTKPPPQKETRDSQWDEADSLEAGGQPANGGKGKGKGKKGKK